MNDKFLDILRDTGANISIISKAYVNNLFSNVVIKNVHDILSDADKLQVRWGNQEILLYEGYIELEVSLDNCTLANKIQVPYVKATKYHVTIPAGGQLSAKCNIDRVVFEEKIPIAFELDPFENEDLIPILSICLTRRGIQSYSTVPVLNRSNHDIILPPNTSIGLTNQVQSITPIERIHITEK